MKKLLSFLFLFSIVSVNAQSNSPFRFSIYAGTGVNSYLKPVYERFGTMPAGSIWDAGISIHRIVKMEKLNANKLYAGVRYENMSKYKIDHSSAGGTYYEVETDQRALYLRLAFIHEHYLNNKHYLILRFNSNFLIHQRHTGYIYSAVSGRPEEYTYFTNTNDPNRKASYFTGALGLGVNLPYGLRIESMLEPGSSPHADYKLFLGASLNLSWNIADAFTHKAK